MQLITFGTDANMLDPKTRQHQRLLSYTKEVDSYVAVIFDKNAKDFNIQEHEKLSIIQVPKKMLISGLFKLHSILKKKIVKPTVISTQDPFEVGFIGWIYSVMFGCPLHLQIHTAVQSVKARTESLRTRIQYILFLFLLRRTKSFRVVSKSIKDFLVSKGISQAAIVVSPIVEKVPNTVRTESYQGGTINILSVGRFVPVKNLLTLIEACEEVMKTYDCHLTIVGSGPLKSDLENKITASELGEKITLLDWVDDINSIYLKAHIYVHTAHHEGFGMTTVEALTRGVPAVTTPYGGSTEYIIPGVNGYVANGFSKEDIVEVLQNGIHNLLRLDPVSIAESLHLLTPEEALNLQTQSWQYALSQVQK